MDVDESAKKEQDVSRVEEEEEEMTVQKVQKIFPIFFSKSSQVSSFCSLKEALTHDWSKKPNKYFRRIPPTFFTIRGITCLSPS